jgi:hypothetical protein
LGLERSLPFTSCINELRRTLQQSDPPRLQIWQAKSISKTSTERQLIWQIQCLNWCHT